MLFLRSFSPLPSVSWPFGRRYCGIVVSAHLFNPPIGTGEPWSRGEDEIGGVGGWGEKLYGIGCA